MHVPTASFTVSLPNKQINNRNKHSSHNNLPQQSLSTMVAQGHVDDQYNNIIITFMTQPAKPLMTIGI